jgi:hypothetical protein
MEIEGYTDGFKWTVISSVEPEKLNDFFRLYKENKEELRILKTINRESLTSYKDVLYEYPNGDFRYVTYVKNFLLTKNGVMYKRERVSGFACFKDGNFYMKAPTKGKGFLTVTYASLHNEFDVESYKCISKEILKRKPELRVIFELPITHHLSFNSVIKKKLFRHRDLLKHILGNELSYDKAKFIEKLIIDEGKKI